MRCFRRAGRGRRSLHRAEAPQLAQPGGGDPESPRELLFRVAAEGRPGPPWRTRFRPLSATAASGWDSVTVAPRALVCRAHNPASAISTPRLAPSASDNP